MSFSSLCPSSLPPSCLFFSPSFSLFPPRFLLFPSFFFLLVLSFALFVLFFHTFVGFLLRSVFFFPPPSRSPLPRAFLPLSFVFFLSFFIAFLLGLLPVSVLIIPTLKELLPRRSDIWRENVDNLIGLQSVELWTSSAAASSQEQDALQQRCPPLFLAVSLRRPVSHPSHSS